MKTIKLIKIIQHDYDALRKSGNEYRCCVRTLEVLIENLGGCIINETVIIPTPLDEFREKTMKTEKFQFSEYGNDPVSVCVTRLNENETTLDEVFEYLRDNYPSHEDLEYIEENDFSVNQECGGYTYIFHKVA